ncbi:PREDICTED: RBPJ-interacting and tubulin-associated protein 1, partial [Nestor notabilis]|uniref:RBPJ-interacting and tubulin-associated protein 1 n=1 Tax=Nestor notabilis TaxID=176057 RepID=UPI0005238DF2
LRGHTPSFCDESLFGPARSTPCIRKEDVAKLQALLWSPPPAPRSQPGLSPCCRDTPEQQGSGYLQAQASLEVKPDVPLDVNAALAYPGLPDDQV